MLYCASSNDEEVRIVDTLLRSLMVFSRGTLGHLAHTQTSFSPGLFARVSGEDLIRP